MNSKRFDPSRFTTNKAKPLPVLLLLDASGSMNEIIDGSVKRTGQTVVEDGQTWEIVEGGVSRIQVLNRAVKDMIASFAREEQLEHEFLVSAIVFGQTVRTHLLPTKASQVDWKPIEAAGETPLGEALATAKRLLEDKETTPARAYRPVVVLVSDGRPTDDHWEASLERFIGTGRSAKCDRVALAIGKGADEEMMGRFIAGTPNPLFHASDAAQILETFRRVTMSVTVRSRSLDPNKVAALMASPVIVPPTDAPAGAGSPKNPMSNDDEGYW